MVARLLIECLPPSWCTTSWAIGVVSRSCTAIRDNYVYREGIYIPAGTRDPVGEINREIEKRTREGKTRFVIMVDDGSADLDGIQKQIIIPGSASRTWSGDKSETRSFFVEKMD